MFFRSSKTVLEPQFPRKFPHPPPQNAPRETIPGKNPGRNGEDAQNGYVFFLTKKLEPKQELLADVFLGVFLFFSGPKKKLLGMTNFFPEIQDQMVRRLVNLSRRMG